MLNDLFEYVLFLLRSQLNCLSDLPCTGSRLTFCLTGVPYFPSFHSWSHATFLGDGKCPCSYTKFLDHVVRVNYMFTIRLIWLKKCLKLLKNTREIRLHFQMFIDLDLTKNYFSHNGQWTKTKCAHLGTDSFSFLIFLALIIFYYTIGSASHNHTNHRVLN